MRRLQRLGRIKKLLLEQEIHINKYTFIFRKKRKYLQNFSIAVFISIEPKTVLYGIIIMFLRLFYTHLLREMKISVYSYNRYKATYIQPDKSIALSAVNRDYFRYSRNGDD